MTTVRDAAHDVLRDRGMTSIFANPGSTEVPFLVDLPADLQFVLALHEGSVVGLATGYAMATRRPAFVLLHSTPGLGNAVGALATARMNRAPLVVVTGQQDRRHLALEPFLAGRLDGLAGAYPVWTDQPVIAQDVPAAIRRAWHEATYRRGPALITVPMDDWSAPTSPGLGVAAPSSVIRPAAVAQEAAREIVAVLDGAEAPAVVVGAGADDPETWRALVELVDRLGCPVWQEAFETRAGFPQDHPRFAGHLPPERSGLRTTLAPHDVVLVVGGAAFRQYVYEPGPLVSPDTRVVVVSDDPEVVHRSRAELGVLADVAGTCTLVAQSLSTRPASAGAQSSGVRESARLSGPRDGTKVMRRGAGMAAGDGVLRATDVFEALADRLAEHVVLVEETPSSRPDLLRIVPARAPGGYVSAAMGGLGFALPAATGLRMGDPSRPVVAVVGDGSSLYGIHALWSAARYDCGVLFVVLSNGGYAVMNELAAQAGGKPPWPGFEVDLAGMALSLGCPARRIRSLQALTETLDEVLPTLAERNEPLLLDVRVVPDPDPRGRPS